MSKETFNEWSFHEKHVEKDVNLDSNYASAESTLIAAGPPTLTVPSGSGNAVEDDSVISSAYNIGVLDNFSLQQSKQLQRVFEIGSSRSYFIPGRTIGAFNLGRVFYHGDSLMKALYRASETLETHTTGAKLVSPGDAGFYMNLGSHLFNRPFGLAWYFKDNDAHNIGAFYLESCYIQGHQIGGQAGSMIIMEGGSCQYDRMIPIIIADDAQKAQSG